jgi:hypothetical protein
MTLSTKRQPQPLSTYYLFLQPAFVRFTPPPKANIIPHEGPLNAGTECPLTSDDSDEQYTAVDLTYRWESRRSWSYSLENVFHRELENAWIGSGADDSERRQIPRRGRIAKVWMVQ